MPAKASAAFQSSPPLWQKAKSACSRLQGNCAFMVPSFMVLLRGSNTASMRSALRPWASRLWRRPSIVVRIAVGWWAKSSYTVMLPPARATVPRSSIRRRALVKLASACAATVAGTPTWAAAAMAASALSWLCTPVIAHCTCAIGLPWCSTVKSCGAPCAA